MPTPEVTPIPGLCISQSNLTTFINNLNLSFDLMVQTINEGLGVSLTLPGIPPIPLAGMPSISIPKFEAMDINRRFMRQPGLRGYVGNVFPVSQGGKGLGGKYTLPGYPGFNVEGFQGQIPGIDPSTYIINLLNQNYQILVQQLAEEGVTVEVTEIPQLDLCGPDNTQAGQQPGGTSPGATTIVNMVNQNNQNILNGLPDGCVNTLADGFAPLDHADYQLSLGGDGSASAFTDILLVSWTADGSAQLSGSVSDIGLLKTAPTQLFACGHGVRFEYEYSVTILDDFGNSGAAASAIVSMEVFDGDGNFITNVVKQHTQTGNGTASGSDSITISAGVILDGYVVCLSMRIGNRFIPSLNQGQGQVFNINLVDTGP